VNERPAFQQKVEQAVKCGVFCASLFTMRERDRSQQAKKPAEDMREKWYSPQKERNYAWASEREAAMKEAHWDGSWRNTCCRGENGRSLRGECEIGKSECLRTSSTMDNKGKWSTLLSSQWSPGLTRTTQLWVLSCKTVFFWSYISILRELRIGRGTENREEAGVVAELKSWVLFSRVSKNGMGFWNVHSATSMWEAFK